MFTRFLSISLVIVAALITSCQDALEKELVKNPAHESSSVVSREQMTVTTSARTSITSTCTVVDPYPGNDELYLICVPENWNGELILYAHGYVGAHVPDLTFAEGEQYAGLVTSVQFAYATTTYSANGLHIQQGIEEMLALKDYAVNYLEANYSSPSYVYLAGASQGGAITALTLERNPDAFSGGFSLCGPCGHFEKQLNYYGDFRVIFDYYFKSLVKPTLTALGLPYPDNLDNIPLLLINNWETVYVPIILQALQNYPQLTNKLMSVSKAPFDSNDVTTIGQTVISTLWYNFFTTDDAKLKIKGALFDNTKRLYFGTGSFLEDLKLNKEIKRVVVKSDNGTYPMHLYETTGDLNTPMMMEHTTKDPIQLFLLHQPVYRLKVLAAGKSFNFAAIPIFRYGHCNFTEGEILQGLAGLILKVKGHELFAQSLLDGLLNADNFILSVEKKIMN